MVHRDLIIKTFTDQKGFKCSVFDLEDINLVGTPIYDSPAEAQDEAKKWIDKYLGVPHIHDESIIDVTDEPAEKINYESADQLMAEAAEKGEFIQLDNVPVQQMVADYNLIQVTKKLTLDAVEEIVSDLLSNSTLDSANDYGYRKALNHLSERLNKLREI